MQPLITMIVQNLWKGISKSGNQDPMTLNLTTINLFGTMMTGSLKYNRKRLKIKNTLSKCKKKIKVWGSPFSRT